jgi:hypothetical protein
MADFFEKIAPQVGVTAEQFRGLSGPDALQLYVSTLEKANLSQSEMTFFMEAIANDSTRLLPLLRNNGAAMAEQAKQAEALGIALSEVDAQNITDAAEQIDAVGSLLGAFSDQLAAEISPLVSALGRQLLGLAEDAGGVGNAAATSFNVVVDAIATVLNALDALDRGLLQSQTAVDQFALAFRVGLLEIAREIVEIPTAAVNEMIFAINNIPGIDVDALGMSDFGKKITSQIDASKLEIESLGDALEDALSKPLAGDELKRLVIEIREEAKKSAAAARELEDALRVSLRPEVAEDDPMLARIAAQKRGEDIITEDSRRAAEERRALEETQQARTLSNSASFFGNLAAIAQKGGEDQFEAYKVLASAQAAISATMAIVSTLGDPTIPSFLKVPLAFSIGALAAAQVAQIQSQEYQGARAMGGSVTGGNSYMVGENGPEVVTMGGSGVVTPSSVNNNGGTTNVTQVFQLGGGGGDAKRQILAAAPFIKAQAKQAVLEAINQGGAMSRAVGRRG